MSVDTAHMSSLSDTSTLPLQDLVVVEAWREYSGDSASPPSVSGFLAWLSENQSEVFHFVKEPQVAVIAQRLL